MSMIEHLTISELQHLLETFNLPSDTSFSVKFEDAKVIQKILNQQKAIDAMNKLEGSGNGNLLNALLAHRDKF